MTATIASAVETRFHVGLHTSNLTRAVAFYRVLFGCGPAKHYDDYARFELAEPAVVLALYPSPQEAGGALNHVGLRLTEATQLVEMQRRLEEHGIATQRQEGVECCYARQTKFWVTDPDRVLWEIYTLEEDIAHSGFDDPPAPAVPTAQQVWEHRLTDAWPERIDRADGTLDEVRLEGSCNVRVPPAQFAALVDECFRVLRPGGRIVVHGLVGDRPFPGVPRLPGMAALVQQVPVETEPLEALKRAGFSGLFFEKLGDIHCFHMNGVELREMRLIGWKTGQTSTARVQVVYKGPFAQLTDDDGTVFRRGEAVAVDPGKAAVLRLGPAADDFAIVQE